MEPISWADFERVELRIGTIIDALPFPEARKPAYRLRIDFGADIGVKQSSAQITALYSRDQLVGRQILAVVNFEPKKIGPFTSDVLVTGVYDENGNVILLQPERRAPNGAKLA